MPRLSYEKLVIFRDISTCQKFQLEKQGSLDQKRYWSLDFIELRNTWTRLSSFPNMFIYNNRVYLRIKHLLVIQFQLFFVWWGHRAQAWLHVARISPGPLLDNEFSYNQNQGWHFEVSAIQQVGSNYCSPHLKSQMIAYFQQKPTLVLLRLSQVFNFSSKFYKVEHLLWRSRKKYRYEKLKTVLSIVVDRFQSWTSYNFRHVSLSRLEHRLNYEQQHRKYQTYNIELDSCQQF